VGQVEMEFHHSRCLFGTCLVAPLPHCIQGSIDQQWVPADERRLFDRSVRGDCNLHLYRPCDSHAPRQIWINGRNLGLHITIDLLLAPRHRGAGSGVSAH
jgi:hypothetical protein